MKYFLPFSEINYKFTLFFHLRFLPYIFVVVHCPINIAPPGSHFKYFSAKPCFLNVLFSLRGISLGSKAPLNI